MVSYNARINFFLPQMQKRIIVSRHRKASRLVFLLFMAVICSAGPTLQGLLNTGIYSFTRTDSQDSTIFHSRLHQSLSLNVRDLMIDRSLLRVSGIFYMDPVNKFTDEPGFHIYTLSYQKDWFNRQLSVNLGRQFVYGITASKRIDGIQTTIRKPSFLLKAFAGGYLPGLGTTYSPISDHLLGADLILKLLPGFNLGVGISELGRDRTSYEAWRGRSKADITVSSSARQRLGYKFDSHFKGYAIYLRGRHDLFDLNLQDLRTRVSYRGNIIKLISLEYSHREPQILENSIFSVFGGAASQEYQGQVIVRINAQILADIRLRHIQFEGNQADMVSFALGYKSLRFDMRHQKGYGGSYNHFLISANQAFGRTRIYGKLNLGNFKLLEGEARDLVTALLGVHIPVWNKFQLNLEGQALRNTYYQYDTRLYLGLRYRL